MGDAYVDIAILKIQIEGGAQLEIEEGASFKITRTKPRKVINTMNRRRRGKGIATGTAAYTFELEVPRKIGDLEVDWLDVWENNKFFNVTYEMGDGGRRRSTVDCMIEECSDSFSEDGEAMLSISGVALGDDPV